MDGCWPIRCNLFGGIAGAPNEVRRGWADTADPLEGKRSAQAYEGGGVSDESQQRARRHRRLDAMHDSAARLCREAHKALVNDAVMWENWLNLANGMHRRPTW